MAPPAQPANAPTRRSDFSFVTHAAVSLRLPLPTPSGSHVPVIASASPMSSMKGRLVSSGGWSGASGRRVPVRGLRSGVGGGSSHPFGRAGRTRVSCGARGLNQDRRSSCSRVLCRRPDIGASSPWLAPRALMLSASLLVCGHAASARSSGGLTWLRPVFVPVWWSSSSGVSSHMPLRDAQREGCWTLRGPRRPEAPSQSRRRERCGAATGRTSARASMRSSWPRSLRRARGGGSHEPRATKEGH